QALSQMRSGKLLFISRSPDREYRALAAERGVRERVLFLGTTRQVEKVYAGGDAFVLPTQYDSFAMLVTEAMASALPVIVSREAGVAELIEPGVNGLLLDDFTDAAELAQKMEMLEKDRALAARLGEAGRRTVESYSWDRIAESTMALYRQV